TSRPLEEARVPRGPSEGDAQGPPGGRKRGPPASGFRRQGWPSVRRDDGSGHRDEGGPRDRTRGDAGARLPPIVFREHGEGREVEGGRPIPEARQGARGDPTRRGHGGRTSEAREDRLDRPQAAHGETGLEDHRLRSLPPDGG